MSSFEPTGESRRLSQLINWVSGCFFEKSWNPPKRRQDFCARKGAEHSNQPAWHFLAFFYVTLWSWKKLPLFEGFHQQTIRWLPSKSDPQITSKMDFFHNWPDRSCMPCPGRHCCIDLDQLLHWKVGDLGWNVYRHPWNSIQKYCWRCSPKTNFILQKYLKFLCWIRMGLFGTIPTGQCSKIWETIDGGDSYPSPKLGEHRVFWKVSVVDSYIFQSSWRFQLSIYLHHWYVVKFDHFPSKNALRIVETT